MIEILIPLGDWLQVVSHIVSTWLKGFESSTIPGVQGDIRARFCHVVLWEFSRVALLVEVEEINSAICAMDRSLEVAA